MKAIIEKPWHGCHYQSRGEVNRMDDLISRQAAIDELDKGAWGVEWDKTLAKAMIESLPSAQPERNTGEWREHIFDGIMGGRPRALMCTKFNVISIYASNFCPNCGADMRGESDG